MGADTNKRARSFTAAILGVAWIAALAGCVPNERTSNPQNHLILNTFVSEPADQNLGESFRYDDAFSMIRAGLKGISQRYLDPVKMDELALDGIRGLATIDPSLSLVENNSLISLHLGNETIADFPRPLAEDSDDEAADWADLTVDIIRAARSTSEELQEADNERTYEAVFDGMLSGLDVFSRYAGAQQASANRARRDGFGGIGVRFAKSEEAIFITHVQKDSPADAVGLHPGDVIAKINAEDVLGLSLRQVADRLRGPVGSALTMSIVRTSTDEAYQDRTISFNLSRAHIVPQTVRSRVEDDMLKITVTSFNKKTAPDVRDALRTYQGAVKSGHIKGLVLDLRGNPGGLLSQSVEVADLFLDQGLIIATRGRHPDSFHDYLATGHDVVNGKPLVVLLDGDSASAAEIVASALQDLGRAVVVGSSSYGKGTVQTVIRLPNSGEMTLTWSRLVSPSGYALHGLGVMPAVCATNAPPIEAPKGTKGATNTPTRPQDGEFSNILAFAHIDSQHTAMTAWRAAGMIFDGRRSSLRNSCPAKIFQPGTNGDLLMKLAAQVIHDPTLYHHALVVPEPISTAFRN